jgi:hypothetical protein
MAKCDNIINGIINTASNSHSINPNTNGWLNPLNDITTVGTDMSYYDNSGYIYRQSPDGDLIEFKLTDGTKIIKEVIWGRIENIAEKINAEKNNQKYVILDYKEKDGKVKTYEIDCNLSMFMKLIGKEYKSWNQMMMTESVKNGNKVN